MPSIPKGTRDFAPPVMVKRNYIFTTIKKTFERYGYMPLETPCMEDIETLTGKYGDEGDKLIFRILDSGDYLSKNSEVILKNFHDRYNLRDLFEETLFHIIDEVSLVALKCGKTSTQEIEIEFQNVVNNEQKVRSLSHISNPGWTENARLALSKVFKELDSEILTLCFKSVELINQLRKPNKEISLSDWTAFRDNLIWLNLRPKIDKIVIDLFEKNDILFDLDQRKLDFRRELTKGISEKALRYDLTVPFARFVVMNRNDIAFPFKRYQIQPVWRADRPQRGRYREFYQCDVDVVGSDSLLYEVELVQIFDDVLSDLKIPSAIKLNNRKILSGIAEVAGITERMMEMTIAIDKLDKIGEAGVVKELRDRNFNDDAIEKISILFKSSGTNDEKISAMKTMLQTSEIGMKGIEELNFIFDYVKTLGLKTATVEFDATLARGLNYYTGAIFEVKVRDFNMGSICGGGRYDDLTGIFGMPGVSGVGISFGADRIYDVMSELKLFPDENMSTTKILFANFGKAEEMKSVQLASQLRMAGINSEVYPDAAKMKKQFKYADDKNIPLVAIIGEDELKNNTVTVKDMKTGEQKSIATSDLITTLQ